MLSKNWAYVVNSPWKKRFCAVYGGPYWMLMKSIHSIKSLTKILFSFSPDSLANVEIQWAKEIKHFCRGVPIVLVGNKIDLRNDPETLEELKLRHQVNTGWPIWNGTLYLIIKKQPFDSNLYASFAPTCTVWSCFSWLSHVNWEFDKFSKIIPADRTSTPKRCILKLGWLFGQYIVAIGGHGFFFKGGGSEILNLREEDYFLNLFKAKIFVKRGFFRLGKIFRGGTLSKWGVGFTPTLDTF